MDSAWAVALAIVPSIGVGFLFYKVLRALLEGDRNERLAHARWEAGQSANIVNPDSDSAADRRASADLGAETSR